MNSALQQNIEYRHKKFDQNKRARTDSSCSSGGDSEEFSYIKQEMEQPIFVADTSVINLSTDKRKPLNYTIIGVGQKDALLLPAAKRLRRDSFSNSLNHLPSVIPLPAATIIPPTTAILPKISDDTLRNICKYHGNMVRKFPKKERTPKDQERRNKNTIACRMSRRVKKLEHIAIEEQYKEFSQQAFNITERAIRATAYLQELMKLINCNATSVKEEAPTISTKPKVTPAISRPEKKPFTISFLTGNE